MTSRLVFACAATAVLTAPALAGVVVPGNGSGTIRFPHPDTTYEICAGFLPLRIQDGLPAGTWIEIDFDLGNFFNIVEIPGGSLGGHQQTWQGFSLLPMTGFGALSGYNRHIGMNMLGQTQTGPRTPFNPVQSFPTDLFGLQGQVTGDPDFDLLRITAGTGFGMPSPGHTTLTNVGGDNWHVDSFFDITYRIDFVRAPGSVLGGHSGSTTGTTRICLIPAPSAAGVLTLAGLVAGARRRRA